MAPNHHRGTHKNNVGVSWEVKGANAAIAYFENPSRREWSCKLVLNVADGCRSVMTHSPNMQRQWFALGFYDMALHIAQCRLSEQKGNDNG